MRARKRQVVFEALQAIEELEYKLATVSAQVVQQMSQSFQSLRGQLS